MSSVNLVLKTSDLITTPVITSNFVKSNINSFFENNSFESPVISDYKLYGDFTDSEKLQFIWSGGGNNININKGPVICKNGSSYSFQFPTNLTGDQALAMQSTSFIQQTIYLNIGTYVFSMYYIARGGTQNNPINILIDGVLLTTLNKVATTWTLFNYTFNIVEGGNKLIRLEGTLQGDLTTGIDLVAIANKQYFQDLIPFVWLKFDDGDVSGNILKNYGTQNIDATLDSFGDGSIIPNIQTTGQIRGNGCINLVATGSISNNAKGGFIKLSSIQIPSTGFTISQWFKVSSVNNSARLFDFSLSNSGGSVMLAQFLDNKTISTYADSSNINKRAITANSFTDSLFHHYLWTVSQNGDWRVYIDNVLLLNENIGYPVLTNRINNFLGKSSFSGDSFFNGQYDDFRYYNKTLTSDEVNILYNDIPKTMNTNLQNYLENYPPYAIFRAQDYKADNATIPEARGKPFTATTIGNITTGNESGNGSTASIPFLSGTTNSIINFNVNVPTNFTMCSITRYTNATDQTKRDLIIATTEGSYFIHGHYASNVGIAFYGGFITSNPTAYSNTNLGKGLITDWLVFCGKNNSQPIKNILADNNQVGFASGGTGGQPNLNINQAGKSDFAFNQILIWNRVLSDDDMQKVSDYLTEYLNTSSNIQPLQQMATVITNSYKLLWPVNLESLLCHMYNEYDKFQICLQYVAGNVSTTRPQNLNILLSGLPFTLEYKFNSNNRSTITLANIKIDTDTFYQQYSLLQYHTFTSQAIANILINITNMDNDIINETFFNSLIFSFNIIGDPNCKKKISRLL